MDDMLVFERWLNDARTRQIAHIWSNAYFSILHQLLGLTLIILSSVTASSFFSGTLVEGSKMYTAATILGIITTIAAALQTSLKLPEKAEKHHTSSVGYGDLRRDIETIISTTKIPVSKDDLKTIIQDINQRQVELDKKRPFIPQLLFKFAEHRVKKKPSKLFENRDKAQSESSSQTELNSQPTE